MAGVSGPLMSIGARGTIAKTLTFAQWKGIPYARTRVVPSNPRSIEQTKTRTTWAFLQDVYKNMPSIWRSPWQAAVTGVPMTPQNMFLSKNNGVIRTETDLMLMTFSPGSGGGIPPTGIVVTPGSHQLSIAVSAPAAPAGWTLTAAQAATLQDQDPHFKLVEPPVAGEDLIAPYTIVLTGLITGQLYDVGVWLKWLTSNNTIAYSTALFDQDTPT